MLFNSQAFVLGFLPAVLAGFFLFGRVAGRDWALGFLIAASLFFYGWWNPPFVLLLAGSIAANYALGQRILALAANGRTTAARRWLIAGVALNLLLLGWFKYAGFLLRSAAALAGARGPTPDIFLPLAISFFTFQQIMFLVDSFRRQRPDAGPLAYVAFVAFFPHLIAGPIVRPAEILPQFRAPALAVPRADNLTAGLTLFLLGLAKKLVLADSFAPFADAGFVAAKHGASLTLVEAWCAALAYALQIYFDFSGYSDMAIGLARMLNIRFPLNFDSPYQAVSIAEFWRRWHMSLSRFLRDYVYIPLGGNRRGAARRHINLMATMLLGGLWHGAAWTFVLWGGLHGLYLIVHHAFAAVARPLPAPWRPLGRLAARTLTLLAVVVAWVPFRADGICAAWSMLRGMAGLNGLALPAIIVSAMPPLAAIARSVPVLEHLGDARTLSLPEALISLALGWAIVLGLPNLHRLSPRAHGWALTAGFALTVQALFFSRAAVPFLYFRF